MNNDGFYKLWQALLYLHPGCPAVSQLSPSIFLRSVESPVSVEMIRILILNIPFVHRWCRSDNVFPHVLNSWRGGSKPKRAREKKKKKQHLRLSSARGRQITSDDSQTKTFLQVRDRTTRHYL